MYLTLYWTYHIKHGFLPSFKLIHFNVRIKMEHQLVKLPSNTSGCWILYELEEKVIRMKTAMTLQKDMYNETRTIIQDNVEPF